MNQMNYPHDIDVILRRNVDILQQWIEQKKGPFADFYKSLERALQKLEITKHKRCNCYIYVL